MPDYRVKQSKADKELADVIERVADAVAGAKKKGKRRRILESATPGQRLLVGYYLYWDDVTNGGHRQYFWNYTGSLWREALEATRTLGLPETDILREAVALFPNGKPARTERKRRRQLAMIDGEVLGDLDDRFADVPQCAVRQFREYIASHPKEFFLPEKSKRAP